MNEAETRAELIDHALKAATCAGDPWRLTYRLAYPSKRSIG